MHLSFSKSRAGSVLPTKQRRGARQLGHFSLSNRDALRPDSLRLARFEALEARQLLAIDLVSLVDPAFGVTSGNANSSQPSVSSDGRWVAFVSSASNLVLADTNNSDDVFVRDMQTAITTRVSTNLAGDQSNGASGTPRISANGRYVVFESDASNLVPGDANGLRDVFVKDLQTGQTTRVNTSTAGVEANGISYSGSASGFSTPSRSISDDGRYVTFSSHANNLVAGDTNSALDVFIKDLQSGVASRVSTDSAAQQASGASQDPSLSGDGQKVVFFSQATNLVAGDTNGAVDVFVKDLTSGITTRASTSSAGAQSAGGSIFSAPSLTRDGRYVTFISKATNLVSGDTNGQQDVFVKDLQTGSTTRANTSSSGVQASSVTTVANVSENGRYVAFASLANNLVAGDTNGRFDTFVKDMLTGSTIRVSLNAANGQADSDSEASMISDDGRRVVFNSTATNLHPSDASSLLDVFRVSYQVANVAPTDIALSAANVQENSTIGSTVGAVSGIDPDAGDVLTFALTNNAGGRFELVGSQLQVAGPLDFEFASSHNITIRATDSGGLFYDESFTITITNVNEAPISLDLSSNQVIETAAVGTPVGVFAATDPDAGDSFTYSLVAGEGSSDNARFTIVGGTLKTAVALNYETQTSYSIRVQAADSAGNVTARVFTILVTNYFETPIALDLIGNIVAENSPVGTAVGTLFASVETGDSASYSLVTGVADNHRFSIDGALLRTAAVFDFESSATRTIQVRATNSNGLTLDRLFTVFIVNVNDAPTGIVLSTAKIAEDVAVGTLVGSLSATDPDVGSSFSYSLMAGAGSSGNSAFSINGTSLKTATLLDFEAKSSYDIRIRATDPGGLFFEKNFVVTVTDVQERLVAGPFGWAMAIGGDSTSEGDSGQAITSDAAGNVYVAGTIRGTVDFDPGPGVAAESSTGSYDAYVAKYSATGSLIWRKLFHGDESSDFEAIALDSAGNIYTAGAFQGTVDFDPAAGSNHVANRTSVGGFLPDIFISKLDANGTFVWAKTIGGTNGQYVNSLAVDSSGNAYIAGTFSGPVDFNPASGSSNVASRTPTGYGSNPLAGADAFVTKLNANGSFAWVKTFGGVGSDRINAIAVDGSGNVYCTGSFEFTADFNPADGSTNVDNHSAGGSYGSANLFVSKLNANGNYLWAKTFGSAESDYARGLALDQVGNVYTTGTFYGAADFDPASGASNVATLTPAGSSDIYVSKLDANGAFVWAKSFGGSQYDDQATAIDVTPAGNVYLTGYFFQTVDFNPAAGSGQVAKLTSAKYNDIFISRLNASGNFVWAKSFAGDRSEKPFGITVDGSGNVYTTGEFLGTTDFNPASGASNLANLVPAGSQDMFLSKLSQSFLTGGATAVNGYLVGATAFFDANLNGVLDSQEPSSVTDSTGAFLVETPAEFDTNQNGQLDDDEGQWVVMDGIDSSTGLPAVNALIAPASWNVVTPLTTLVSALIADYGFSTGQAVDRVTQAFGLPTIDLGTMNPVAQTLGGDAVAPWVFATHAQVQDTIAQSLAVFAGAGEAPVGVNFAKLVLAEIAEVVAAPGGVLDLTDNLVVAEILRNAASASGVEVVEEILDGAAVIIAETNLQVENIPVASNVAYLTQVAQVKTTSQGAVADQLELASHGDASIEDVVASNTGSALAAQIAASVSTPTLFVPNAIVAEATSAAGAEVSFAVFATNLSGQAIDVVLSHESGSLFGFGTTTVTATATDGAGISTAAFTITVADTLGPKLSLPQNLIAFANVPGGAIVAFELPTASDVVDANPIISWDTAPGFFPMGTTIVTVVATDASANTTTEAFTITVVDQSPVIVDQSFLLVENSAAGAVVGTVLASDSLGGHDLAFNIIAGNEAGAFAIDPVTGEITVTALAAFDHAANPTFELLVEVTQNGGPQLSNVATVTVNITEYIPSTVVGRWTFYNNSRHDGNRLAADSGDDAAIAVKSPLLPGNQAAFGNYTSYSRGINGIMVDIQGLAGSVLNASDFQFRVGDDSDLGAWALAPTPTNISVRTEAGNGSSSRVSITWSDFAIKNTWLQVTVKATTATGLAQADVFYFGNAVGESGNDPASAVVNTTDEIGARNHGKTFLNLAAIDDAFDFNRDGLVNATDQILARSNSTTLATALKLISVPSGMQVTACSAPSGLLSEETSLAYANIASGLVALARKTEERPATALHETLSQLIWTAPPSSSDTGGDRQISQLAHTDRCIESPYYGLHADEELFDRIVAELVDSHS